MNKVLNWTVGSFFRTIGRLIAFIVAGIGIAYILSISDIDVPNIFRHAIFMNVKAEQIVVPVNPRASEYYYGIPNWSSGWTISSDQNFAQREIWAHNYIQESWLQFGSSDFTTDIDYLEFSIQVSQPLEVITNSGGTSTIYGGDTCATFTCNQWDSNNQCLRWHCTSYTSDQDSTINNTSQTSHISYLSNLNLYAEIEYTNGNKPMCTMAGTSIICPTNHLTPYRLHLYFYYNATTNTKFDFSISRHVRGYYVQDQQLIIDSINNQTQQQQDQHEEMMDSNTTQAEDDAEDFFESFDAPDIGGLSAIITAPLSTIQSLLNSSCTNLVLPLPFVNKDLTLPCMNDIYTEHFGAFFSLYQTIILGIIAYRCIRSIFFDLQGFANPSDDRIEVMDL